MPPLFWRRERCSGTEAHGFVCLIVWSEPFATGGIIAELRSHLGQTAADYMVPARPFMLLERLPLTPNGKLDRSAAADARVRASTDHSSRHRAAAGVDPVRAVRRGAGDRTRRPSDDDFFPLRALGGNSLLAPRLNQPHPPPPPRNVTESRSADPVRGRERREAGQTAASERASPGPPAPQLVAQNVRPADISRLSFAQSPPCSGFFRGNLAWKVPSPPTHTIPAWFPAGRWRLAWKRLGSWRNFEAALISANLVAASRESAHHLSSPDRLGVATQPNPVGARRR